MVGRFEPDLRLFELVAQVWLDGTEVLAVDGLRLWRARLADRVVTLVLWRGDWKAAGGTLAGGALAGLLFAMEFLFIAQGLVYTSASHMAVFIYTAPIFSALGLHFLLPSERLRPLQWLGIAVCFGGIALCFGGGFDLQHMDSRMLLGDFFGVLAGASWGATTVVVRSTRLSEAPTSLTLFYQLFAAALLLPFIALALGEFGNVRFTALGVGSVLFQGVVVSFFSYFAWFWLLRRYLASNLAVFSFMTPLFGVTLGVLILHEPLTLNFVLGAVLVLGGIGLVSGESGLRRLLRRESRAPGAEPQG